MDRDELDAELRRLLQDLRRVGAQRFLAEVEHVLHRFDQPTNATFAVAYAGVAEGTGAAFPARVVFGKATFHGGGEFRAKRIVTTPDRLPVGQLLALVVLVVVVAQLVWINTSLPPPEALRADLTLIVELLLVCVVLPRAGDR